MTQTTQNLVIGTALAATVLAGAMFFATPATVSATETESTVNASSTASTTPNKKVKKAKVAKVDASCMSEAIGVREDALMSAWEQFGEDVNAALSARKSALMSAWGGDLKKERGVALKKAWSDWRQSKKQAHTKLRVERKQAWDTFRATAKTDCKANLPKDEALEKSAADTIPL